MADEDSARATPFAGSDGALLAATLGIVSDNPRVDALLERQIALADLQIDSLRKLDDFELSHLRWRRFADQMRGAGQMMLVLVGLLILAGLGAAIWDAANDRGLVVEAFSVPPDLAAKGLTGEVIASKVLDRLAAFQAQTVSGRASASYANNWGDDIKVQIPNTGVSIGEFNRALHQWLGHATHISGEVWRTPDGIALAARVGGASTPVLKGSEAAIDALVDGAAERVYRATQPYRYASWLSGHGRVTEANTVLKAVIDTGDARERAWANNGMSHNTIVTGDVAGALIFSRRAIASDPSVLLPLSNFEGGEGDLGHDESALAAARTFVLAAARGDPTMDQTLLTRLVIGARLDAATYAGDFTAVPSLARQLDALNDVEGARADEGLACAFLHDQRCFRAAFASLEPSADSETLLTRRAVLQTSLAALGQWEPLANAAPGFHTALLRDPFMQGVSQLSDLPLWALAEAHLGDVRQARALIAATPLDCSPCLRARARIEALGHDWHAAETWFARAVLDAPSIPFAYKEWGEMLLAKGDPAGAIAKFEAAHARGPHYADPLELWGEALIAQNRSDLALAKFEDAAGYTPNWGRLHLKWGEALLWSGDRGGAAKQFAAASALDLTAAERTELQHVSRAHG
jgi:tetratricopeptide (TPR) repeat protein